MLSFEGGVSELQEMLLPLNGEWSELKSGFIRFKLNSGFMDWEPTTGEILFKGQAKDKAKLEESIKALLTERNGTKHSGSVKPLQQRITKLLAAISAGMFEREETIAVALLGALCGQNTFLFGPPGTAKSLISRRIAYAFADATYFEYLMNRFSTPEEVFGPVSIKALKEDQYIRKTENYLPQAEFAFLDEIWKSSPAILNTLLTLINERIFRNGESIEQAPLKALIAASNETPDVNQGLEALYDRFVIRLWVGPINQTDNFTRLLNSKPTAAEITISDELLIKPDEWQAWREQVHDVQLSEETLTVIQLIRESLAQRHDELGIYVSDRRWQRAAMLMKASALFNERMTTNHSDALLLQHCLWTQEDNREALSGIVNQAIKDTGLTSQVDIAGLDIEKDLLEKEIRQELFHSSDIYQTKNLSGEEYYYCKEEVEWHNRYGRRKPEKIVFYIPVNKFKSADAFHPVDEYGNELDDYKCQFDNQSCYELISTYEHYKPKRFMPQILFHRGVKKEDINERLVSSLLDSVGEVKKKLGQALSEVKERRAEYEAQLASPFITEDKSEIAISGIIEQVGRLKLRIKDCEHLEALCQ